MIMQLKYELRCALSQVKILKEFLERNGIEYNNVCNPNDPSPNTKTKIKPMSIRNKICIIYIYIYIISWLIK